MPKQRKNCSWDLKGIISVRTDIYEMFSTLISTINQIFHVFCYSLVIQLKVKGTPSFIPSKFGGVAKSSAARLAFAGEAFTLPLIRGIMCPSELPVRSDSTTSDGALWFRKIKKCIFKPSSLFWNSLTFSYKNYTISLTLYLLLLTSFTYPQIPVAEVNRVSILESKVSGGIVGQVVNPNLMHNNKTSNKAGIGDVLVKFVPLNRSSSILPFKTRTDHEGIYQFYGLDPGMYRIEAEKDGYYWPCANEPRGITVYLGRTLTVNPPPIYLLPSGEKLIGKCINSSSSGGPNPEPPSPQLPGGKVTPPNNPNQPNNNLIREQVNKVDMTLRGNSTVKFITALPLRGIRSFDTFALLVPGVMPPPATNGANGPGIGPGVGTSGQFSVNGQRARSNNFTIDGSDNNDQDVGIRRQGFTSPIPQSVESILEFEISTLLDDAEAGRNTGGQVNVVSQFGGNELHGQIYDFFTNSALNARDFFDLTMPGDLPDGKPTFTRNQLGCTFSFPILKERFHFFGAFEQQNVNRVQQTHFAVPTLAERTAALNSGKSALGRDVLALYPLPNNPGGPYGVNTLSKILPASGRGTLFSVRLDYRLSNSSTFYTRYNFTDDNTRIPSVGNAINASITALTRTQNIAFTLHTRLSDSKFNELRFSYGRTALRFDEVAGSPFIFQSEPRIVDRTGNGILNGRTGPIGRLLLEPFSPIGVDPFTFPQERVNNTFQIADTFLLTHGRNTFRFGADIRRVQFNSLLDRNYRAQLSFTSNLISLTTGGFRIGSGADFAGLGLPSDIFQALAITPDSHLGLRFTEMNLFANDSLRIHPRVTLNFGLRYERSSVPTDVNDRLEKALTIKNSDLPINSQDILTKNFLKTLNAQRQFLNGRDKIYEPDNNNFAPRVGVAWDLFGDGRMALRAGYGIFYDSILGNVVSQSRNVFPTFIPVNFGAGVFFPEFLSKNPAFILFGEDQNIHLIQPGTINTVGIASNELVSRLGQLVSREGFALAFTLPDKNLRTPYVQQYSIAFERTLQDRYVLSVAYVGTMGHKLIRFRARNGGAFTPFLIIESTPKPILPFNRLNPRLGAFTTFESSANSNYHALQVSLVRPIFNSFGLQMAYTYGHAIDDVSDIFDLAGSYTLAQDETERKEGVRAERGNASFDIRHRFTTGWQYELSDKIWHFKVLKKIFGGTQLSGILTLETGQPFTVNTSVDVNFDGNRTDRLNTTDGLILSDHGVTRIRIAPGKSPLDFLAIINNLKNPSNGSVGRNTFRAAGTATVDIALDKRIAVSGKQELRLRLEAFNLFNRTHFGIPVRILEAPSFGSSVNTSLPARTLQIAVRYSF